MDKIKILWADDEIDLLKPQLLYLDKKGYDVTTATNGHDVLDIIKESEDFDVIFLDESMPGITGLETLAEIRKVKRHVPVVMITKNEEEHVMEEAIGSEIADYLIKPVNPNQILLTLKKITDNKRLVREKVQTGYQQEFRTLLMDISSGLDHDEWLNIYKRIIDWEMKLDESQSDQMSDILSMQKTEANSQFSKYITKRYQSWFENEDQAPTMSHNVLRRKLFPKLSDDKSTIFLLLDNLRYDQWLIIAPVINQLFRIVEEDHFYSILPTSTQYSRNAIFAGMMPSDIYKNFPNWWLNDNQEGGKNLKEKELLGEQIKRTMHKPIKHDYLKITKVQQAKHLQDHIHDYLNNDLTVIVYNFIDMLSHARTEMEVLKELAGDERAYRSLTLSWFEHSPLWQALQLIANKDFRLVISTDHGTIRVRQPSKVVGDRETTTNLRYKVGRNLKYDKKDVLDIKDPYKVGLPKPNMSSTFIFAKDDRYFLYPNNYNHYNNYYRDTFQHGGISLEEMICPFIVLEPRN